MARNVLSIVISDEDKATLEALALKGHSYPATVARFLLAEKISEKREELNNGNA